MPRDAIGGGLFERGDATTLRTRDFDKSPKRTSGLLYR